MLFSQIVEGNRARYTLFLYHRLLTNKHLSISLTAVKEAQSASVAGPVFFIHHNCDLDIPHELIGLAKDAGRDVVKLQSAAWRSFIRISSCRLRAKVHGARPNGVKS